MFIYIFRNWFLGNFLAFTYLNCFFLYDRVIICSWLM